MHLEKEVTVLEIDKKEIEERLKLIGATKVGDFHQKRFTYDFIPFQKDKWIRLRSNGKVTTLTIKEIIDRDKIDGTKELEIEVSDFEKTNELLENLGYYHRNYQENLRTMYLLDNTEISIDTWPLIPTYMEIEGKNNEDVIAVIKKLELDKYEITSWDVTSIYEEKYGIDILNIKELKLEAERD